MFGLTVHFLKIPILSLLRSKNITILVLSLSVIYTFFFLMCYFLIQLVEITQNSLGGQSQVAS